MPYATARDMTRLYYEEAGSGSPVLFVHEFAADYASWEPQMRYLSRGTAASPIRRAAIRPPMCRPTNKPTATNM